MKWVKDLYQWVLGWAKSPYGSYALFVFAFVESIFFPIPPDILLIALALGMPSKSFRFALNCSLGSVLGAVIGYTLGYYAWISAPGEFTGFAKFFFDNIPGFTIELYEKIRLLFEEWNFWVIFTAGFTPIPYKVFTITAGVFHVNFSMFLIASAISRSARFFLVAWLIWKFGPSIKSFIDKYFNWLALGFTVFLIGGFVVIKYLL